MSSRRRVATQRRARLGGVELELADPILAKVEADDHARYLLARARLAPLPPAAQRGSMREVPWMNEIIRLARQLQFYAYHPTLSRWSERGWPDVSLLGWKQVYIEAKDDTGVLTEPQVTVLQRMHALGIEAYVLRPWHGLQLVANILQAQPAAAAALMAARDAER